MKHILLLLAGLVLSSLAASAQIPRTVTVQGIITDASGTTVITPGGNQEFRWELRDGTILVDDGTVIGTVKNGVFNVNVGPFDPTISFARAYDLLIIYTIGSNTHTFRTPLNAVPYALHSDSANASRVAQRAVVAERLLSDSVQGIPPVGAIIAYFGIVDVDHPLPDGWLLCDGQFVSESVYPRLHAILRTLGYDGKLPNLQGMFLRGADLGTAYVGYGDPDLPSRTLPTGSNSPTSQKIGTIQPDTLGSHEHGGQRSNDKVLIDGGGTIIGSIFASNPPPPAHDVVASAVFKTGDKETRPINMYVNYIIRAQ